MTFYGNTFVSSYHFFRHYRSERMAHASSLYFTGLCQIMVLDIGVELIKKYYAPKLLESENARFLVIAVLVGWMIGVSQYYSLARVEKIAKDFDQKSDGQKMMWNVITVLTLVLPAAILGILYTR